MTLQLHADHQIVSLAQEPAVAHIHFKTEDGMVRFLADNRTRIKSLYERWTVDWEPLITITAKR